MEDRKYRIIGNNYKRAPEVPKDHDIFYRCERCGDFIPSVPKTNIGCECGNLRIDFDMWRFMVEDYSKLSVLRVIN